MDRCGADDRATVSIRAKARVEAVKERPADCHFSLERRKGQRAVECDRATVSR